MIIHCAVIGNPISHSLSPKIHSYFAKQAGINLVYEKLLADDFSFHNLVKDFFKEGGRGLNITLPFKEHAFKIADRHTARATKAQAANTLWMQNDILVADNTDGLGLVRDLFQRFDFKDKNILILGAGGAARGIIGPLCETGLAKIYVANRTIEKCNLLAETFPIIGKELDELETLDESFDLIINATSAGVKNQPLHLAARLWKSYPFCYDLSYKLNTDTDFVAQAKSHNCKARDGLGMLIEQAAESFAIWHDFVPDTAGILNALKIEI